MGTPLHPDNFLLLYFGILAFSKQAEEVLRLFVSEYSSVDQKFSSAASVPVKIITILSDAKGQAFGAWLTGQPAGTC